MKAYKIYKILLKIKLFFLIKENSFLLKYSTRWRQQGRLQFFGETLHIYSVTLIKLKRC